MNLLFKTFVKHLSLVLGWGLIVVGVLTWPLPLPIGLPLIALGGMLVYTHSSWARQHIQRLRNNQRYPRLSALLVRFESLLSRLQRAFK